MRKHITLDSLPFILAVAVSVAGCAPPYEYECHDFSAGPEPISHGKSHPSWFQDERTDLAHSGIMLAIPRQSEVFGTISFRHGGTSLVYPLYSWDKTNGMNYTFGCNGPPGFSFAGTNKMSFLSFIARKAENEP